MAKSDFCFNYYDGDATRDMAHMNRLERGAYHDVIIQQRQRGHLSIDDLKKFLSKDFEAVWDALEWVLKKDAAGKFYIEWLENSEIKAKEHAARQAGNRQKAEEKKNGFTTSRPNDNQNTKVVEPKATLVAPLEDGNGNEYGNGSKAETGNGVKPEKIEIVYPFESEEFRAGWQFWKDYKKREHRFSYKSEQTEQIALKELAEISGNSEQVALRIIQKSVANGYKGLFEIKNNGNARQQFGTSADLHEREQSANEFLRKSGYGRKAS